MEAIQSTQLKLTKGPDIEEVKASTIKPALTKISAKITSETISPLYEAEQEKTPATQNESDADFWTGNVVYNF